MNSLALIRWPGSGGGSGSGGTEVSADNGLSVLAGLVVLGQNLGQLGAPAKFLSPRELPFNGNPLIFTGIGSVSGGHVILRTDAGAAALFEPYMEFQDNTGSELARLRVDSSGGIYFGVISGVSSTGSGNIGFGAGALSANTTGHDNISIGGLSMFTTTTSSKTIAIGSDLFNGVTALGDFNIGVGHNSFNSGTQSVGDSNILIGSASGGAIGDNNILLGTLNQYGGDLTNSIIISYNKSSSLSNVIILGNDTQNTILGGNNAVTNSGDRLQILGTLKVTTIPVSGNLKKAIAWDTVTNQIVDASGVTTIFTADNGLNVDRPNNVELGGPLTKVTTITTSAFSLSVNGAVTGGGAPFNTQNTVGPGLIVFGTTNSTAGAVIINNGTGAGVTSTSNGGAAFNGQTTDNTNTNTTIPVLKLLRETAVGTAGAGIGGSIEFYNATTATSLLSNSIVSKWLNPLDSVRLSQISLTGQASGNTNTLISFIGNGQGIMSNALSFDALFKVTNTEPTNNNNAIQGISTNGGGVNGTSTNSNGISGQSSSGNGGAFSSTSGAGITASTNSGTNAAILATSVPSSTNTVVEVGTFRRLTSGTPANGIGASISLQSQTTTSTVAGNTLISTLTNATGASPSSQFSITGVSSGTVNVLITISGAGIFTLTQGLSNFANDAAAAIGGIPVNGLYRNGSIVQIRVT